MLASSNMEWFTDDPRRGQVALTLIAFVVAVGIVALGRKRPLWAVAFACIWLLLAAMAIPSYMPARPVAYRNACINNLRMIQDAKLRWAAEKGKSTNDMPTADALYGVNGTNPFASSPQVSSRWHLHIWDCSRRSEVQSFRERAQAGMTNRVQAKNHWSESSRATTVADTNAHRAEGFQLRR
jgi:hypothetical protein